MREHSNSSSSETNNRENRPKEGVVKKKELGGPRLLRLPGGEQSSALLCLWVNVEMNLVTA